ncbi:hypothetical protein [Opitutus terrae]|uniref:Secreted protein n=1 Tax=Opitutus terrae (strain DSM 11246 / JCM 15787 / PB90-1) TaxID=452637 RepID=B1ZX98_OPITP|nr:hypothetical protein [Opitutus terrae]ACB76150.1 secreted protein [Opitutus terrae PB90-1]
MSRLLHLLALLLLSRTVAFACEVCSAQQPSIWQRFTHGGGPQGPFDYVIVLCAVAVVGVTLGYSLKYLLRPGERGADHIKRAILEQE